MRKRWEKSHWKLWNACTLSARLTPPRDSPVRMSPLVLCPPVPLIRMRNMQWLQTGSSSLHLWLTTRRGTSRCNTDKGSRDWKKKMKIICRWNSETETHGSVRGGSKTRANGVVLGQISRAFHYRFRHICMNSIHLTVPTYVRTHLELSTQAWAPWTEEDKNLQEKVPQRAVKMA